jgi:hypothetical protein
MKLLANQKEIYNQIQANEEKISRTENLLDTLNESDESSNSYSDIDIVNRKIT